MDWKAALADLRTHLPPAGHGSGAVRGSLRWLEAEMRLQGGNPAAVRNIIYRDVGRAADKAVLTSILRQLATEAGRTLELPEPPASTVLPEELELLGRTKKRIYKQFLAGIRSGRSPHLVVSGRAGAGKTVLLDQIALALEKEAVRITRLNLTGDVAEVLHRPHLADKSFAALAARQAEAVRACLPHSGVFLVRVTRSLNFAGDPPRLPDGSPVSAAGWAAEYLFKRAPAQVALLLALEDGAGWPQTLAEVTELRPPTRAEARSYLMEKLGISRSAADTLIQETGLHLDKLTLLAGAGGSAAHLLADADVRHLAGAVAALGTVSKPEIHPDRALSAALGRPVHTLPIHARSLIEQRPEGWQPARQLLDALPLLGAAEVAQAHRRLLNGPRDSASLPYHFAALLALGEWERLAHHLQHHPDDARFLPELWPRIRAEAPAEQRERLAQAVVSHHAGRGEYHAPNARDALFALLESEQAIVRAWGRVKLAESSVDAGHFDAAAQQLTSPEVQAALAEQEHGDPWLLSAQADALLVQAALARWQGNALAATQAVRDPRTAQSGPRARLWRGLIAKDAGRWNEAIEHLQAVPDSSPLLSARALYQEGDLRLRLGQTSTALQALLQAAQRQEEAGGSREELARILARAATAQRRLGEAGVALELMHRALELVPTPERTSADGVPRARLLSEGLPILLALGRPDAALSQAVQALELLELPGPRRAEAEYRTRRTHYRIALAYLTRGVGLPYQQPFAGAEHDNPDLQYARALLDKLLQRPPNDSDREQVLTFDMRLSRALMEPNVELALEQLQRALDMTDHVYAEAQARALVAEAHLRAGQPEPALAEINRAHALLRRVQVGLPGTHQADPGLHAQLLALEARAGIGDGLKTLQWLQAALAEPALQPFRAGIWREAGRALETQPHARAILLELHPEAETLPLRVMDALVVLESGDRQP